MDEFEKSEFWKALGRLYDASVRTNEGVAGLLKIVESHEKRLDKAEVKMEAILEELRRRRSDQ
jgi:hypothetical protein